MKTERDKFLTEAMGLCWHNYRGKCPETYCLNCNQPYSLNERNINFSTWQGFGALWEFLCKGGLHDFVAYLGGVEKLGYYIEPNRFADKLYEYWKNKEKLSKEAKMSSRSIWMERWAWLLLLR